MSLKKFISNYTRYNHWANETATSWLRSLDESMLYTNVLSSFASIHLTMQHMHLAQRHWLNFITRGNIAMPAEVMRVNDADLVINDLLAGSQLMIDTYLAFSEDDLLEQLLLNGTEQSRYDLIVHSINHNSYHRGQIVTISRGLGVVSNIPETDYDTFLWYLRSK